MKSSFSIWGFIFVILFPLSRFCNAQESFPQLENIIPPSPTASSLGMYAEIPVTLYTGSPSIHIPLWEVQGRKLSFTISLDYHSSGIKVNDIAGWTGLGWSLNAGGIITRTVRGIADDHPMGYLSLHGNQLPSLGTNLDLFGPWKPPGEDDLEMNLYLSEIADGRADSQPDMFFFNVNGRSGKIILNGNGQPVVIPHQNLIVSYNRDQSGGIDTWEIVDENGTRYQFGGWDASEISTPINEDGSRRESFISSWYLKQIRSANNEDNIVFSYIDYHSGRRDPLPQKKVGNSDPNWDDLERYSQTDIDGKFLREIEYSKGTILFNTLSFGGYPGGEITGLDRITIKELFSQETVKIFQFDYSFFETAAYGTWHDYLPPSRRLRLDNITELSGNGESANPPYMFFYNSTPLPPRGSYAQDHWGYFNGAYNEYFIPEVTIRNYRQYDSIPPTGNNARGKNIEKLTGINLNLPQLSEAIWRTRGANREPNEDFMKAGMLQRIVYPTGGSTVFEFEPHDFGYISLPRKPMQSRISASYDATHYSSTQNMASLNINHDQEIRIIPLFYVLKGSIKDAPPGQEDTPPSNLSSIFIVSEPKIDEDPDTIFSLSFQDYMITAHGLEAVFNIWIPAGHYAMGALSEEEGDYTEMIIYSDSVSPFDETYPIYSNDYENLTIIAGKRIWEDDESYYCSEIADIGQEDENLVKIEFLFKSKVHPNQISAFGLDIPLSMVRIKDFSNPENIIFERMYSGKEQIRWYPDQEEWIMQQSFSKLMNPGKYLIEFIPRIKTETGYISMTWRKAVATHNHKITGGLRVRKIIKIDNESDTIGIREFDYTIKHDGIIRSSGILQSWPSYYDVPDQIYYLNEDNPIAISYAPITLYSSGKNLLGSTQGSHIGYRQVTESSPVAGKTIHRFTSAWEYPDISNLSFPYPPATSFDWKRGLKKQTEKLSNDGLLREVETITFNSFEDSTHLVYIPAFVVARKFPESNSAFVFQKYANVSSWNYPKVKKTSRFDIQGENPIQFVESYLYDPDHLQIKQVERVESDNSIYLQKFYYPGDTEIEPSEINNGLVQKHMVNTILKKETIKNGQLIAGTKTNYGFFNGSQLLPASNELLEGTAYEVKLIFDQYDGNGNLLQYHTPGDLYHSINWGWAGTYPVAETTNSVYKENVNLYPAESRTTKYAYQPLIGVRSITAPDERSTFYEYDDFGRLTLIRDQDQNIVKRIDYHFKPNKGDTTRTYWTQQYFEESTPADFILTDNVIVVKNCTGRLSVSGGSLGSNAEWKWYVGSCGGTCIGSGSEIVIAPLTTTTYYVRATGDANSTICRDITIEVVLPTFNLLLSELAFDYRGNTEDPTTIETNYTGCDPWNVSEDDEWLSITNQNDNNFTILCNQNDSPNSRTGKIFLYGDGEVLFIPVHQTGSVHLEISYLPTTILSGDDVSLTATVLNGTSPYRYTWETRVSGATGWTTVRDYTGSEPLDTLLIPAATVSFDLRCSVTTGGKTVMQEIEIIVAE